MKFSHALLALDLSLSSEDLVRGMADLKEIGIKKVTLLTVVTKDYPNGKEKFDREVYESKLTDHTERLKKSGIEAEWVLKVENGSYAPTEILDSMGKIGADLLVIGNKGHTLLADMLLGSVASEVIHRAEVPLLLLRISDKPGKGEVSICKNVRRHILLPIDFSEAADQAMQAFQQKELRDASVTVLNVQTMPKEGEPDKLQERVDYLKRIGVREVQSETRHGNIWIEITEFADKKDASMILMGSQGKGYAEDVFIGSNSLRVARHTSKPLLLIPAHK
ncbi:universal stress protein [Gracilimonas amylolytica]|uniref:universal stress protein n=1 Tax=Gracilimonas amylolytica TaxID=1749045 RepID=UPI000CD88A20|nr:universal stress protein [Gracilimonas amylolytica]